MGVENYPDDETALKVTEAFQRTGDVFKDITGRTYIEVDGWLVPQDVL